MLRKARLAKLAVCLLAISVVFCFSIAPVLAEDPVTPVPFTATGVVVSYSIPGTIIQLPDAGTGEGEEEEEPTDGTDGTDGTLQITEVTGPYITIANETGEFTYAVSETVVITGPQAETGEYIINPGDLAQVTGNDDIAETIAITPAAVEADGRSLFAAVPGIVEAIAGTSIVVATADGLTYSFVITEATAVYAGPLTAGAGDILAGDRVVVKGDGAGNAKWIRFTGQSSKAVRSFYANGGDVSAADAGGRGHGKGLGKGHGKGKGPRE